MESSPAPAPLPQSYDDRAVLQLEPLRDAFIARELGQRRMSKAQEREWVAGIAKDVRGNKSAAEVARRWLMAISASGKRAFWNFVLPLDDETFQLFVRFFWLIHTKDLSAAKKLLASSRRSWGLESYLYEFTVSKRLESVDGSTLSSAGVPNWVPYSGGAKSSNTPRSLVRKRSILRSTSFPISRRPMAVQSGLKKKRRLNGKTRLALRRTNSAGKRVRANKNIDSSVEVASDRGRIARGNKRKLGHDDARSHRRPGGITDVLRLRPRSGKRSTEKTSFRKSERLQRVSEPPVEYDDSLERLKRHRSSKEEPNERDPAARNPLLICLPGRNRGRGQTPIPLTGPGLNASPSNVTGAAMATSTSKTRRPVAAPYPTTGDALGYEPDVFSNSIPYSAITWPESCPTNTTERASKRASVTTKHAPLDVFSSRSVARSQTSTEITGAGAVAELDRDMAHIRSMDRYHVGGGVSALVYTFDRVAGEIPEDEDDLHDVASSEYRDSSHIGLEKEPAINLPPKPRLSVRPPIWAQSRQEVCESLDSFRSFQGGVYQSNDIVKGYLLGAHSSSRDLFHHGGRLIISHGGGKAEALRSKNGRLEIQGPEDQLEDDRSVRALLNNYRTGRPLVVLADNNYVLFPFDLTGGGYTYVVLGLYWIAHAWAELQQIDENHSVVRYKFAFQWCEGQGDPWWTQGTEATPTVTQAKNSQLRDSEPGDTLPEEQENLTLDGQDDSQTSQPEKSRYCCPCCRSTSPLVYQDAPMCLQPSCAEFWRVGGEDPATHNTLNAAPRQQILSYSTELLRLRPPNHIPVSAESLYPPLPDASNTTPRPFAKGIHCRHCGRLSTRFKWEHFECSHCHRIYGAPPISFSHKDFWLQEQTLKFYQHRVAEDSGIVIRGMEFRSRTNGSALPYVQTFDLPYNRGSVHLIPGHPSINGRANDLFREYQKQAATGEIQFRRWPLRAHKCRGQLLSNYFSQNTGAPYQYVGGAERTTPLEDGAEPVLGALDLIRHRIATALGKGVTFNEVLSAAYMEKQKMAFHSDSERGLGPVVASLSLGSVAEMHFRLHSKYTTTEGHRKVAMSLVLRHGDVLVMEGAGVQEYYEHAVVPKNFRIVATARSISPENYET